VAQIAAGGGGGVPHKRKPPTRRTPVLPRPEVSVQAPARRPSLSPRRPAKTVFSSPVGRVDPVGRSPEQRSVRQSGRRVAARQQIANTRRIIASQQPAFPDRLKPAQQQAYVKVQRQREEQASRRAAQIAFQHIAQLQARTPNPKVATETAIRQTYEKFHTASEIGRLTKVWTNPKVPLEHRVGALRALRNRYGVPVTQANYKAFRQAQKWHEFLHDGKEGDTFTLPEKFGGAGLTLDKTQTYQLRRKGGKIVPVAVYKDRTGFDVLTGRKPHWFEQKNRRIYNAPSVAAPLVNAASSATTLTAERAAGLVPEGKIGNPIRSTIRDLISLPRDVVNSAYYAGSAVATGHGGELVKAIKEHDPIALAVQGKFGKAGQAVYEHPLLAVLEVAGGRAAFRAAGRARGVATERAAAILPGSALSKERVYSTSRLSQRAQRARETRQTEHADRLYREAEKADVSGQHTPEQIDALYRKAAEKDPRVMQARDVQHVADVHEALGQPMRRRGKAEVKNLTEGKGEKELPALSHHRGAAIWRSKNGDRPITVTGVVERDGKAYATIQESKTAIPLDEIVVKHKGPLLAHPREGGHLQRPIVEGIAPIRALKDGSIDVGAIRRDVGAYRSDLATQAKTLTGKRLRANEKLRARLDETLKLPDAQIADLAGRARHVARATNAQEARNVELGQLQPEEATIAKLKTYAIRHIPGVRVAADSARLEEWEKAANQAAAEGKRPPARPEPILSVAEVRKLPAKQALAKARELERQAETAGNRQVETRPSGRERSACAIPTPKSECDVCRRKRCSLTCAATASIPPTSPSSRSASSAPAPTTGAGLERT
jgi:hypothetical protein